MIQLKQSVSQLKNLVLTIDSLSSRYASTSPEEFEYIDIASVDREKKSIIETKLTRVADAPSRAKQLVRPNDILVSTVRPNLNAVAVVPADLSGAIASTGFCVLRPNPNKLCHRYLYHWVRTPNFISDMVGKATGASYPAVSDAIVKESLIPLPPLSEQKRIADILNKADAIRRKRQEALAASDALITALFRESFGDPVVNSRGLDTIPISDYGTVTTGNTPSRKDPSNYGDQIEWIKSDNINTRAHWLTQASEGLSAKGLALARAVPSGSTLVTCIAGSPSCVGNAAMTNRTVAFNQQINAVTPAPEVDQYFLYSLILLSKSLIQRASTASMKGMVSKGKFERIEVIKVGQREQKEFGRKMQKILSLVNCNEQNSTMANELYESLVQRAFKGEL